MTRRWFKTPTVSSEGLGASFSCCWLWRPKRMTYSLEWWKSKNARVRLSGILGFNSLVRQTLKNNILSLRTLLVELINVTSSKSDLNRSPCLHHLLCHSWNYFWVLQLLILLGFGQNIFSISYHIWSRRTFTLWELGERREIYRFCWCWRGHVIKEGAGKWSRSGRERGRRRARQMRWKHTSHFNWLSLHSRKLIDDNDKEELFTLCKANSLIDN